MRTGILLLATLLASSIDPLRAQTPDTDPPTVVDIIPQPGSTNRSLNNIEVLFSEPVTNVQASDLLINGAPATQISFGIPGQFIFNFATPATGVVQVAWAPGHGITDLASPPNPFAGGSWTYVLDPNLAVGTVIINEFLASNSGDTYRDEDGDASDWIELYNFGSSIVDLSGWSLTDDASKLTQWRFPGGSSIGAGGYLVVFASGKNKTNATARLHTNFNLRRDPGEYLALVNPGTNVVSDFAPKYPDNQQTDVSYGRDANDPSILGFFTKPSPGARNEASGAGIAPEVTFSRPSGTFVLNAPFDLTLSTTLSNATIRYAFGTNVPGPTSNLYSAPLQITNTTMIRARAFAPGLLPGPITTKMYIALTNAPGLVNFNSTLPIMILHNYGRGTFPASQTAEREVMVQTFEPGVGNSSMTNTPTLTEFGIAHARGSSTLGYAKTSFFLEIQDEFRADKEVSLLGLPEESDWVLYAPNNFEPALFHNPLAHQLARDGGEYSSRTRFVEVFLKDDATIGAVTEADYNGIYVLEEKIKRDKNRIDIEQLEPEHTKIPEVTGGYAFSIDRGITGEQTFSAGGATLNWIYPDGNEVTNLLRQPGLEQMNYIRTYLNDFNNALNNNTIWTNPATGYAAYIDVDSWVRRHIHEVLTFNVDALRLSGYFFKGRNKKIEYGPAWDYDRTQGSTDGRDLYMRTWRSLISDFGTDFFNFTPWWQRLFNSPDFWQRWIDKYQEAREGYLSFANISNRIEQLAAQVRPAQARELARWGIAPRSGTSASTISPASPGPGGPLSYTWGTNGYENEVRWKGFWYSNRLQFMDTQFLARPNLSTAGGLVSTGATVTITPLAKPGSTLYYTLDGTDPRLSGGAISPSALSSAGPVDVIVTNNIRVFARSWNSSHRNLTGANNPPLSSPWSGSAQGTFYTYIPPLRITEIMYHPQDPTPAYTNDSMFEYIEVKNIGTTPLNLNRFTLSGGVEFDFPNASLSGGESAVIVANITEFQNRYGASRRILGQYSGFIGATMTNNLDNGGERLVLSGPLREPILDFSYDDEWYPITDGFGFSLVIVDDRAPVGTWGLKSSWRPSGSFGGSPSQNDPAQPNFPPVVVNEALTHTDLPSTDAIELYNLSTTASATITGWYLTDDFRDPKKYRLPTTVIAPGGFAVFNESNFNVGARAFSLSSLGDAVYLFSADASGELTGYVHGFDFGAAENGRTFGRYVTSTGSDHFPPQISPSLGAANSGPLVGPVVISEIQYHPVDLPYGSRTIDNDIDEYIELHNISASPAPLYNTAYPTNTWRLTEAVEYQFPLGTVIPAGGFLLVVGFDPTNTTLLSDFRARNAVSPSVPIFGPWQGKLDNSGETVELRRPDRPEPEGPPNFGLVPYVLVERVRYADTDPWPLAADGIGPSLQRRIASAYGNDPANWTAAAISPGNAYGGGTPPVVTVQPQNTTVIGYHDTSLSVSADGPNLRYQWLFEGNPILGATNSTLFLNNVQPSGQGNYRALVMNPAGSAASSNAFLTVLIPPNITTHPQSQNLRVGQSITFFVVAESSTPISYQWYFRADGAATETPLAGATSSSYSIASVDIQHRGSYRVRVTDSIDSIFSQTALLTVLIDPVVLIPPMSQTVASNFSVTLSVLVTNTATLPLTYQWRVNARPVKTNVLNGYLDFFTLSNVMGVSNVAVGLLNLSRPGGVLSATAVITAVLDTDKDGIPDAWEATYGFATNNAADAVLDEDGDKLSNRDEYLAGTNPTNSQSYFFVEPVSVAPGVTETSLRFNALSNHTYSVQYRSALGTGNWTSLEDLVARATNRVVEIRDTSPDASRRFYQLVTPRQP